MLKISKDFRQACHFGSRKRETFSTGLEFVCGTEPILFRRSLRTASGLP